MGPNGALRRYSPRVTAHNVRVDVTPVRAEKEPLSSFVAVGFVPINVSVSDGMYMSPEMGDDDRGCDGDVESWNRHVLLSDDDYEKACGKYLPQSLRVREQVV